MEEVEQLRMLLMREQMERRRLEEEADRAVESTAEVQQQVQQAIEYRAEKRAAARAILEKSDG